MGFLLENWTWVALALASGGMLFWLYGGQSGGGVDPARVVQLMNKEKAVVVDVCSAAEYAQGHIAGAKNVPLDALAQQLPATVKNKATPVVLVCQAGARAKRAAALVRKMGYDNVHVLAGGLQAWQQAQLPVQKSAQPT